MNGYIVMLTDGIGARRAYAPKDRLFTQQEARTFAAGYPASSTFLIPVLDYLQADPPHESPPGEPVWTHIGSLDDPRPQL